MNTQQLIKTPEPALLDSIQSALAANDFTQAINLLQDVVDNYPSYHAAWYQLAQIAYSYHQWDKALEFIRSACLESPDDGLYELLHAQILVGMQEFVAANNQAKKIQEKLIDNLELLNLLGYVNLQLGNFEDSYAYYQQYVKLDANNSAVFNNLGCIAKLHKLTEIAEQFFAEAVRISPDYAEAYNNLGLIALHKSSFATAQQYFQQALSLNPNLVDPLNNLGNCYNLQKNNNEALNCWLQVLNKAPQHVEALNNVGKWSMQNQQYHQAIMYLSKALEKNTGFLEAKLNLAISYMHVHYYHRARKIFALVVSQCQDWQAFFYLGVLQQKDKKFTDAIELLQQAALLAPKKSCILEQLALACYNTQQISYAKKYLKKLTKQTNSMFNVILLESLIHNKPLRDLNKLLSNLPTQDFNSILSLAIIKQLSLSEDIEKLLYNCFFDSYCKNYYPKLDFNNLLNSCDINISLYCQGKFLKDDTLLGRDFGLINTKVYHLAHASLDCVDQAKLLMKNNTHLLICLCESVDEIPTALLMHQACPLQWLVCLEENIDHPCVTTITWTSAQELLNNAVLAISQWQHDKNTLSEI